MKPWTMESPRPELVAEPFVVAEVTPVDEKKTRVRGPLLEIDEAAGEYIVALRPFHHRNGDFGRLAVQTNDDTEFEINGESFFGADGLQVKRLVVRQ